MELLSLKQLFWVRCSSPNRILQIYFFRDRILLRYYEDRDYKYLDSSFKSLILYLQEKDKGRYS